MNFTTAFSFCIATYRFPLSQQQPQNINKLRFIWMGSASIEIFFFFYIQITTLGDIEMIRFPSFFIPQNLLFFFYGSICSTFIFRERSHSLSNFIYRCKYWDTVFFFDFIHSLTLDWHAISLSHFGQEQGREINILSALSSNELVILYERIQNAVFMWDVKWHSPHLINAQHILRINTYLMKISMR